MVAVGRIVGVQVCFLPAGCVCTDAGVRAADEDVSDKPAKPGKLHAANGIRRSMNRKFLRFITALRRAELSSRPAGFRRED
jgi:hypothetical protein